MEELQLIQKINKNIKSIKIKYISGKIITLKSTVNIMSDTLIDLYNIILNEVEEVNITCMIINDYLYK